MRWIQLNARFNVNDLFGYWKNKVFITYVDDSWQLLFPEATISNSPLFILTISICCFLLILLVYIVLGCSVLRLCGHLTSLWKLSKRHEPLLILVCLYSSRQLASKPQKTPWNVRIKLCLATSIIISILSKMKLILSNPILQLFITF